MQRIVLQKFIDTERGMNYDITRMRRLRYHIRNHIDYVLLYSFGFQHI